MRQLTDKELAQAIKGTSRAAKLAMLQHSLAVRARIAEIKAKDGHIYSIKYVDEMIEHALFDQFPVLMKLDALHRLRRDFVRHDEDGDVDDMKACIAKIDEALSQFDGFEPNLPELDDDDEDGPLGYHEVSRSQDKNINILENVLPDIDANIDEIYADADAASRVAAYMAAFENALTNHLTKKFKVSRKEIRRFTMAFCQTLIEVDKLAQEKRPVESKFPDIHDLADNFSDMCERKDS